MSDWQTNSEPFNDEQLVAYLDGEMPAADAGRLEARLADDDSLRSRLHELDGTWRLLDQLETDAAGCDFTRTTLEMVATAEGAGSQSAAARRRRTWRAALASAAMLVAGIMGFLAVAAVRPDPNRRLLDDLPVLEGLHTYRAIDSVDFLRSLYRAGLFQEEWPAEEKLPGEEEVLHSKEDEFPGTIALLDAAEAARQRIEAMDPAEKQHLQRRRRQFESLDSAEQARLRRLYRDLAADPNAQTLHAVAVGYYDWLRALPPITRAELLALEPEDRVDKVQSLLTRQAAERARKLGSDEARILWTWLSESADRLIEAVPEPGKTMIRRESDPHRRLARLFMTLRTFRSSDAVRRVIDQAFDDDDLAGLRARLPDRSRLELEQHPTEVQWRIVKEWVRQLLRHRATGRAPGGPFADTEEQSLMEFFENELDDAEFDRLLALPAEEMQRELQQLYLQRSRSGPPGRFRRPGPSGPRPRPGGPRSPAHGAPPAPQRFHPAPH